MACSSASKTSHRDPRLQLWVQSCCSLLADISYVEAPLPMRPVSNLDPSVYRRRVPTGKEEIQSAWCLSGWSCVLVLTEGADWTEKVLGVADRFSRVLEMRCLIKSHSRLIPGSDIGQCGVGAIPARLCPAGRKRCLMANFADR
jgi:hypothetical protein